MKFKITELVDLYDYDRPEAADQTGNGAEEHREAGHRFQWKEHEQMKEASKPVEVRQTTRRFGWKEGLSIAAAVALVVLGGFGVKSLLSRKSSPISAESQPTASQTLQTEPAVSTEPSQTEPAETETVQTVSLAENQGRINELLSYMVERGIRDLEQDLADEYELVQFAHIYTKLHHYEDIVYRTEDDESYETLTLDQVNAVLTELLGKTVSPADGTDYTAQRGDNYVVHETFRDGVFYWPAADGDMYLAFAIAALPEHDPVLIDGKAMAPVAFRVYVPLPERSDYDPDALTDLTWAEADAMVKDGKLEYLGEGAATVQIQENGSLQLLHYMCEYASHP